MQVESGATHSFILREENGVKTTELCASLCRETVEKLGFVLWDVEFQKEYGDWVLTFYIDKEGGVTIEDCEAVSRALEPVLDEADPIEQAYTLSVSSLGLDRPLKQPRDFERNMGKPIEVKLYQALKTASGRSIKQLHGTLISFDESAFTLKTEGGKEHTVLRKDAALVRPYIEF